MDRTISPFAVENPVRTTTAITCVKQQEHMYTFITNCKWAYAQWQCYINNEQYISSTEYRMHNSDKEHTECKNEY
jgi:hypothetical protein